MLTPIISAYNLIMFCHADPTLVDTLKSCLDMLSRTSDLIINHSKNALYLSNIEESNKAFIQLLRYQLTVLSMRYLGIPLVTTWLTHADCISLVERIIFKIKLWTTNSHRLASAHQINSFLFSGVLVCYVHIVMLHNSKNKKCSRNISLELNLFSTKRRVGNQMLRNLK